jgi:exodeoxyribonuclease-3
MAFTVATWNVNSLRVRLPLLLAFLTRYQPDLVALQETKVENEYFPLEAIRAIGYYALFNGQRTYNGVALLSRVPLQPLRDILPGQEDLQSRLLSAYLGKFKFINIYVPNGSEVGSDKYQYKLRWLAQLHDYLQNTLLTYPNLFVLGDYNIAPTDQDVYDVELCKNQVLTTSLERRAFQKLLQLDLYDSFRLDHKDEGHYTWWDYRQGRFRRNQGLRIDHILCSQSLVPYFDHSVIDIETRKAIRPSDHAPLLATFNTSFNE